MRLFGKLQDTPLPELLQVMAASRITGKLRLTGRDREGLIVFRKGHVVYSASSAARQTLGNLLLLDVRTKREYDSGHIAGAVLIPHKQVERRLDELAEYRDRRIVVYCEVGGRARKALNILSEAGFENLGLLEGDMRGWRASELPVEQ